MLSFHTTPNDFTINDLSKAGLYIFFNFNQIEILNSYRYFMFYDYYRLPYISSKLKVGHYTYTLYRLIIFQSLCTKKCNNNSILNI